MNGKKQSWLKLLRLLENNLFLLINIKYVNTFLFFLLVLTDTLTDLYYLASVDVVVLVVVVSINCEIKTNIVLLKDV